jgi:hypothetical protein
MNIDSLPFFPARDFKKGRSGVIRVIVIHDAECAETAHAAEDLGKYVAHPDYPSSWHISCDSDSCERSVHDDDTAYAAPPLNPVALHIELAGQVDHRRREQWLDTYSDRVYSTTPLPSSHSGVKRYNDPGCPSDERSSLNRGRKGIVGHYQMSAVYKKSDHTDPGINFPWDAFMHRVAQSLARLQ